MAKKLDQLCAEECQHLIQYLHESLINNDPKFSINMKPLIGKACANIFNRFFCSVQRCSYEDKNFGNYCKNLDDIFWEVNNGRAVDFLPWLMPYFLITNAAHSMQKGKYAQKIV